MPMVYGYRYLRDPYDFVLQLPGIGKIIKYLEEHGVLLTSFDLWIMKSESWI